MLQLMDLSEDMSKDRDWLWYICGQPDKDSPGSSFNLAMTYLEAQTRE
jgi:hypothetical protein